ncbi:MAG: hypothetical protein KA371_11725 [Acidobacteria bacterium]|nr:hypothetical protein [Acidobacteriota bacterium]
MNHLIRDTRMALRALTRAPLASALAVICLALGIGTNATMFSVVSGTRFSPLPFRAADQLVTVWSTATRARIERGATSYLDLRDFQEQTRAFDALVGVGGRRRDGEEPSRRLRAVCKS